MTMASCSSVDFRQKNTNFRVDLGQYFYQARFFVKIAKKKFRMVGFSAPVTSAGNRRIVYFQGFKKNLEGIRLVLDATES